jgi:hypothetical protein
MTSGDDWLETPLLDLLPVLQAALHIKIGQLDDCGFINQYGLITRFPRPITASHGRRTEQRPVSER